MQVQASWAERARTALEAVSTTEERIAATLLLVGGAVAVGWALVPRLQAVTDKVVVGRFDEGPMSTVVDVVGRYTPVTLGGVVLRVVQASLFVGTALAVLVLWGLAPILGRWAGTVVDVAPPETLSVVGNALLSLVVLFLSYVGSAAVSDALADFGKRTEWMTEHQEEVVLRVSQLGLFLLAGMVVLGVWGQDLSGLLIGAGFLGIVVGLAARQTLGSLIAGFVLMFSRPFTIGDWVEVAEDEGIVTDITIVNTRLENFDGETVVIPNDRVANQPISNRSERGHLRIKLDVGIDYEADPERAADVARDAIEAVNLVTDSPPPRVIRKSFGDSAIVLELRFWIDRPMPPRKWQAIDDVVGNVKDAFEAEDIKIPFPQREISGRAETGGFRLAEDGTRVEGPRVDDSGVEARSGSGSASDDQ
jgi:small-conductance mechanosensitive channel